MDDDRVDAAIDAVARALTARAPDAALRARILARLESPPRWRRMWIVAPAAAAVTIALAIGLISGRREPDRPIRTDVPGVDAPRNSSAQNTPAATAAARADAGAGRSRRAGSESAGLPNGVAARAAPPSDIASLAASPLVVESIAVDPIDSGDPLTLSRLDAPSPLDVAPLSITDAQKEFHP
jgi:hypothetical protein